jgi:hypothetical protein
MGDANKLYGGRISDFADSMAEEIESAYNAVLQENGKDLLPTADADDRRMLFVAIARGVINHLQKKQTAITVVLPAAPAGQTLTATIAKR